MAIRFASAARIGNKLPRTSNFWDGTAIYSPSSYESIQTITVGSGGSASISFTSIPATYKHLQIRGLVSMAGDINIRFNGDTNTNYSLHFMYGAGGTPAASNGLSTAYGYLGYGVFASSAFTPVITDILDYTNTNKYKVTRSLSGNDNNSTGGVMLASSFWQSTSAVTSITIYSKDSVNFNQYSTLALYGIKG
jgi:hypothetical protein